MSLVGGLLTDEEVKEKLKEIKEKYPNLFNKEFKIDADISKDLKELIELASGVCSIASSECCGDGHGKFWSCEECSCQDGYLDYDENGKAFFHKLGTCDIHRCSQKINELIEKGYDPWEKKESENV